MTLRFHGVLALAVLVAPAARATTMLALDVAGLARSADAVVHATVGQVTARWSKDGGRIITDIELTVVEAWKGTSSGTVMVMQPGGVVGDIGQRVDGIASFVPGEEVVVFLEARGDRFTIAGMAQGRFKVERSSDGQATSVRQDQCGELHLVDAATRQPVSRAPMAMPLLTLKQQVGLVAPVTGPGRVVSPQVTP